MKNLMTPPFLRWAGGKRWLARSLNKEKFFPTISRYHEPFLGCGAVFFSLFTGIDSTLSDLNNELISTYISVKNSPHEIISELNKYENNAEFYYKIRSEKLEEPIQQAARFIYLNQTSFNGIYRVNTKGEYNVPFGYRKKSFLDESTLIRASQALSRSTILCEDFSKCIDRVQPHDLVYLDPPYTVTHNQNGFIKYNEKLFSLEDFLRLSELITKIKDRNAYYILSNAAHPQVKEIFSKGDIVYKIRRPSLIGGKNAFRGEIEEFVFTNIELDIFEEAVDYEHI